MYELKNECNKSIQTIPADIRTSVLERIKTRPKYYNETWQHFYQRCQNICHDQFELFYPEARKAARWVMERIEKHVILKKNLEEQMKNMTFDDLKSFDCSQHWEGVKNEKGNVIKNYAS